MRLAKHDELFAARVAVLEKGLRSWLWQDPTALMKSAIDLAAKSRAEVDRVFANPASTSNDRVRAISAYRMARGAVLEANKPPEYRPTLDQMLAGFSTDGSDYANFRRISFDKCLIVNVPVCEDGDVCFTPKADICDATRDVRFGPIADINSSITS